MQSALGQALEEARRAGADRIEGIRLRIGTLSGVVPEALQFAFEALRDGTAAGEAALTIEEVPARFWCDRCRCEFEPGRTLAECPSCKTFSRELRSGREMELASLEIS